MPVRALRRKRCYTSGGTKILLKTTNARKGIKTPSELTGVGASSIQLKTTNARKGIKTHTAPDKFSPLNLS